MQTTKTYWIREYGQTTRTHGDSRLCRLLEHTRYQNTQTNRTYRSVEYIDYRTYRILDFLDY